jgi:hypothetical protein
VLAGALATLLRAAAEESGGGDDPRRELAQVVEQMRSTAEILESMIPPAPDTACSDRSRIPTKRNPVGLTHLGGRELITLDNIYYVKLPANYCILRR